MSQPCHNHNYIDTLTYSHANTPLGESERAYYLSYFIIVLIELLAKDHLCFYRKLYFMSYLLTEYYRLFQVFFRFLSLFPFLFWIPDFHFLVFQTSTLSHPRWKACDESLVLLSIFFCLTDRTRESLKQMKSDISETLKTLVSPTKVEGKFPHTVARWKLSIRLK